MNKKDKRHLRTAIKAMNEKYQRLAYAANLHEKFGLDDAPGRTASKERQAIREAKEYFKQLLSEDP